MLCFTLYLYNIFRHNAETQSDVQLYFYNYFVLFLDGTWAKLHCNKLMNEEQINQIREAISLSEEGHDHSELPQVSLYEAPVKVSTPSTEAPVKVSTPSTEAPEKVSTPSTGATGKVVTKEE